MKKLVVIVGIQGSGISLIADLSQCIRYYLGKENKLNGNLGVGVNLDEHFENAKIVRINDSILQCCDQEWYSLETPELDFNNLQIKKAMDEIRHVVRKLLEKSDTAVVKDSRISVLMPLWDKILKELNVEVEYVWVFRNPLEIMELLRKEEGYCSKYGFLLWIHYNLSILKFLKGKKYLLIQYEDLWERAQTIEDLGKIFDCEFNEDLRCNLKNIIKREYVHSEYSYQDVKDIQQDELLQNLYDTLLMKIEDRVYVSEWEKCYRIAKNKSAKFIDYDVLENIKYLYEYEIIIYGAGKCGHQAAEILQQLGFSKYNFCDKDISKQGQNLLNGKIFSVTEIENKKNVVVIVAIENKTMQKEVEQTLMYVEGISFLSFFALKTVWKYFIVDYTTLESKAEVFSLWYRKLEQRCNCIKNASRSPVLVYQNGKVGSQTISNSLWNVGIRNAHIHRFFFQDNMDGELMIGEDQMEFVKKSNAFCNQSEEYQKRIKREIKGKKIITLVRDPVAVDLSTVFQWIGNSVVDKFFAENIKKGQNFSKVVSELMIRIQNRMFRWFDEELKVLSGIDVFEYPFDKEKGYVVLAKNDIEILLAKVEKLSQMTEVIGDFVGNHHFELININVGKDKEYGHIYEKVKNNLKLPKKYIEQYYKNNVYTSHFYSEEEQEIFFNRWSRYIADE